MAICEKFHVMPWDIDRLTVHQFEGMCQQIDDANREAARQQRR